MTFLNVTRRLLCLFPVAKGALFLQKKLGSEVKASMVSVWVMDRVRGLELGLRLVVAAAYRPLVSRMSLLSCVFFYADSGRLVDTLIH